MKPIAAQPRVMKSTVSASAVYWESARNGRIGRAQDEEAAHRRRPLLHDVCRRTFRSDLLSEIPRAQRLDELGPDDDGGDHGQEAGDQDWDHAPAIFAISAAMPSSPTAREALTSTASPGRRKARAASTAPSTSAAHTAGPYARAGSPTAMTSIVELASELADLPVIPLATCRRARPSRRARRPAAALPLVPRDGRAPPASSRGWRCRRR